jgi:hypothetical protein
MESDTTHQICNYKGNVTHPTCVDPEQTKSVCGGLFYLGSRNAINGPIVCSSKMISCVVASAAAAELAAGFQQAQLAVRLRHTLHDLGYPQQPTWLLIDNTVAIGLGNDTMNKRDPKVWTCVSFGYVTGYSNINLLSNISRDSTT